MWSVRAQMVQVCVTAKGQPETAPPSRLRGLFANVVSETTGDSPIGGPRTGHLKKNKATFLPA